MSRQAVLVVHNHYQEAGGEDTVFAHETALLRAYGHPVNEFVETNDRVDRMSSVAVARDMIWSTRTQARLAELLREKHPQVAHFHNTFLLISPAAYYTCRAAGVPVVQSLHNYRLLCPGANFHRSGRTCEDCLHAGHLLPGVLHGCYRGSRLQTAGVASMLTYHRIRGTWANQVDMYIALSEFAREKFVSGGLPRDKIAVKPNFVYPDPGARSGEGQYVLVVSRLSYEKGVMNVLKAWTRLRHIPLKIAGDGPIRGEIQRFINAHQLHNVELLGQQPYARVMELLKQARFLLFASELYENFPMTIVEAYACGVPVLSTHHGSMQEIIDAGRTGAFFQPGDSDSLAATVETLWSRRQDTQAMGTAARETYLSRYTAERNYGMLMAIYARAHDNSQRP